MWHGRWIYSENVWCPVCQKNEFHLSIWNVNHGWMSVANPWVTLAAGPDAAVYQISPGVLPEPASLPTAAGTPEKTPGRMSQTQPLNPGAFTPAVSNHQART